MEKFQILLKSLYSKAKDLYIKENYKDSLLLLKNTTDMWQDNSYKARCLMLIGMNYIKTKEFDLAERALLESVAESLNNPKVLDILGGMYYSLGKYEDADSVYRTALREDGYNVDFVVKSARILWKLGDISRMFKRLKLGYALDSLDISEERKLDKFLLDFIRNSDLPQSYYYLKKIRSWYSNYKKRDDFYF